jgi:hypothetical protein
MNKFLLDVFQLFAPYKLSQAANPDAIAEREYASAAEIGFTQFTSCIGVIAKEGPTLTAVHLVAATGKDHIFNTNDVSKVLGRLPKKPDAVSIVGSIDIWEDQANGKVLTAAFQKLTDSLQNLAKDYRGDGKYGARIAGDTIVVFSK